MTNAEKLAKDTAKLSKLITDSSENGCRKCSAYGLGVCFFCKDPMKVKAWLEAEAEGQSNIKEEKRGKWIQSEYRPHIYHCSLCGEAVECWSDVEKRFPYSHCGAKMF